MTKSRLLYPTGIYFLLSFFLSDSCIITTMSLLLHLTYDIIYLLSLPNPTRKEGERMEYIVSFLLSVGVGITCHYICKWLDGPENDN